MLLVRDLMSSISYTVADILWKQNAEWLCNTVILRSEMKKKRCLEEIRCRSTERHIYILDVFIYTLRPSVFIYRDKSFVQVYMYVLYNICICNCINAYIYTKGFLF